MKKRFSLYLLLLLSSCSAPVPQSFSGKAMHIDYQVHIGDTLSSSQAQAIEEAIQKTFEEINTTFNYWNKKSEISQLSHMKAFEKKKLSCALQRLLQKVDTFYLQSNKRFDITIAPLVIIYRNAFKKGKFPAPAELEQALHTVGWDKVHLEGEYLWKEENTSFDLGGIAKGAAVDLLTEKLVALGLTSTYVAWGGEIRTWGKHPSGRPWCIGIENSDKVVELENRAIATSGDTYQYWRVGGKEYFHIINPLKKVPLEKKAGGIASATVIAPTCIEADVVATTLMLFEDIEEARVWVSQFPEIECILSVRN